MSDPTKCSTLCHPDEKRCMVTADGKCAVTHCAVAAGSAFRFRPAPGHYTRENWLAYRVIAQLSESGLDINHSPAVQVWDVAHREIIAWMEEHGIKTGLRPQERESSPNKRLSVPADEQIL